MFQSSLYRCNKAGYYIEKRGFLSSKFWGLKVQDGTALSIWLWLGPHGEWHSLGRQETKELKAQSCYLIVGHLHGHELGSMKITLTSSQGSVANDLAILNRFTSCRLNHLRALRTNAPKHEFWASKLHPIHSNS